MSQIWGESLNLLHQCLCLDQINRCLAMCRAADGSRSAHATDS